MENRRRPLSEYAPPRARRSLNDVLGPAMDTAQALLIGSTPEFPRSRREAPAGWYKDPTGSGQLRFYDGSAWTWRTRPVPRRHLNSFGLAARRASISRSERSAFSPPAWLESIWSWDVEQAQPLSVSAARNRSGSVGGMLLLLVMVAALTAALVASWQIWGTDMLAARQQSNLTQELRQQGLSNALDGNLMVSSVTTEQPLDEVTDPGADVVTESPMDAVNPIADPAPQDPSETAVLAPPAKPVAPASAKPGKATGSKKPAPAPVSPAAKPGQSVKTSKHEDIANLVPAGWTAPAGRDVFKALPAREGAPYGRIRIPAIGVDETLVAGTSEKALKSGPGVWRYGSLPGQPGNSTIAGHRTTYGAPFNRLDELKYGDLIYVEVPGKSVMVYEVRGRAVVDPANVDVTGATDGVRLTLSTCHPKYSARYRLVVQAEMVQGDWLDAVKNRSGWHVRS